MACDVICCDCPRNSQKLEPKDVLRDINRMQAAAKITLHPRCLCTYIIPLPLAAVEWSRLLLNDVICSECITVHFQWEGNLSLVTLTIDLDIQTHPSEGPDTVTRLPCEFSANPFSSSRDT